MIIPNRSLIIFMNIGYALALASCPTGELKVRGHYMGFRVKYKNDEASF